MRSPVLPAVARFSSSETVLGFASAYYPTLPLALTCARYPPLPQVILGSQYAGCMKQALFTLLNWHLPRRGILPLNSGCSVGPAGDATLFFGLSGAGWVVRVWAGVLCGWACPKRAGLGSSNACP